MVRVSSTTLFSIIALLCIILSSQVSVIAQESTNTETDDEYLVKFTRVEPELVPKEKGDSSESLNWNSYGPGMSVADFDNDGDMDLYISARFSHLNWEDAQNSISVMATFGNQMLFENKGNFSFKDVTNKSGIINDFDGDGVSDSTSVSGVWGDYNSDGFLDLYVSEFGHTNGKYAGGKSNILYHNNGNGTFTDVTEIAGVGNSGHSSVAQWVDYDHDGDYQKRQRFLIEGVIQAIKNGKIPEERLISALKRIRYLRKKSVKNIKSLHQNLVFFRIKKILLFMFLSANFPWS